MNKFRDWLAWWLLQIAARLATGTSTRVRVTHYEKEEV